jgi:hypothetical protein
VTATALRWSGAVAGATRDAAADPDAGWRATARTVAAALAGLLPPDSPAAERPAVAGLHPVPGPDGTTRWPLDTDPEPGDLVLLAHRDGEDDTGTVRLAWYEQSALRLHDSGPAAGLRVWGGTEAVPTGDPVATAAAPAEDALGALLAGAHALGVADRFRTAFVTKALVTNRGFSAVAMIEDPTVLKALLRADAALAGAAALLREHADRAGRVTGDPAPGDRAAAAAAAAAGIHALDTAQAAVTELLGLTGASSLYDGAPMQAPVLHLGALGQHGQFGRAARLRVTRAYAIPPPETQEVP